MAPIDENATPNAMHATKTSLASSDVSLFSHNGRFVSEARGPPSRPKRHDPPSTP